MSSAVQRLFHRSPALSAGRRLLDRSPFRLAVSGLPRRWPLTLAGGALRPDRTRPWAGPSASSSHVLSIFSPSWPLVHPLDALGAVCDSRTCRAMPSAAIGGPSTPPIPPPLGAACCTPRFPSNRGYPLLPGVNGYRRRSSIDARLSIKAIAPRLRVSFLMIQKMLTTIAATQ